MHYNLGHIVFIILFAFKKKNQGNKLHLKKKTPIISQYLLTHFLHNLEKKSPDRN